MSFVDGRPMHDFERRERLRAKRADDADERADDVLLSMYTRPPRLTRVSGSRRSPPREGERRVRGAAERNVRDRPKFAKNADPERTR
jgi:hypothetical protein